MEQLKRIKEALVDQVCNQITDLSKVDTHELGEVIDMVKDMEESMYYCSIVKAMEDKEKEEEREQKYYSRYLPTTDEWYRDSDRRYGRMYYTEPSMEHVRSIDMHDRREGRSPMSRKAYIESKEMHQDKTVQMKELENYMSELSQDITEMIATATPEEKAILQKKLALLASKVV